MTELLQNTWNLLKNIPDILYMLINNIKENISFLPTEIKVLLYTVIGFAIISFIYKILK